MRLFGERQVCVQILASWLLSWGLFKHVTEHCYASFSSSMKWESCSYKELNENITEML